MVWIRFDWLVWIGSYCIIWIGMYSIVWTELYCMVWHFCVVCFRTFVLFGLECLYGLVWEVCMVWFGMFRMFVLFGLDQTGDSIWFCSFLAFILELVPCPSYKYFTYFFQNKNQGWEMVLIRLWKPGPVASTHFCRGLFSPPAWYDVKALFTGKCKCKCKGIEFLPKKLNPIL